MQALDIIVCGCGPGGMAAALLLHRAGHHVRMLDQLDEPAPIGSGLMLQPTGMAVLAELGLDHSMRTLGRRIDRLFGRVVPSNRVVLDVRYDALGQSGSPQFSPRCRPSTTSTRRTIRLGEAKLRCVRDVALSGWWKSSS